MGERQLEEPQLAGGPLHDPANALPPPALVQASQHVQGTAHRMAGAEDLRARRPHRPPPARLPVLDQIRVGARQRRRAQRGHQRHLVGRVVHGLQHGQQVAHLLGAPHERRALDPVRDLGVLEGRLELGQRRPRREEDGDVGQPRRPPAARRGRVAHQPELLLDDAVDRLRDVLRLALPHRADRQVVALAEEHDRRVGAQGLAYRQQRLVRCLRPFDAFADELAEHGVDPVDDAGHRPEVGHEVEHRVGHPGLHREEQRDVRPAEPVDRLLGVAHEEEAARLDAVAIAVGSGGDEDGQLDLERVGVLELVDEQVRVALAERVAHGRLVAEEVARFDEQVVEREPAGPPPLLGRRQREPADGVEEVDDGVVVHARQQFLLRRFRGRARVAHVVDLDRRPVRLLPVAARPSGFGQEVQRLQLALDPTEAVGDGGELLEVLAEEVVAARAPGHVGDGGRQRVDDRGEIDRPWRRGLRRARIEAVAMVVQQARHVAERVEAEATGQAPEHHGLVPAIVEELVEERPPPFVEGQHRLDLVEHLERRRQPGLEGMLGEDALRERVQGRDRRFVDLRHCARRDSAGPGRGLELSSHPVAQLGRRRLGERDGRDAAHLGAVSHQLDEASDERGGLAGAGAGFDEEGRVEALPYLGAGRSVGDRRARRFPRGLRPEARLRLASASPCGSLAVARPVRGLAPLARPVRGLAPLAHDSSSSPSPSDSATYGASSRASRLRSHWRARSRGHTAW